MGVVVPAAAFTFTGIPRLVRRVLGSGTISHRWVCPECGVWVCGGSKLEAPASTEMRVVRAGTFDDTSWIKPAMHFWTRSAQPWVILPEDATIYETQP